MSSAMTVVEPDANIPVDHLAAFVETAQKHRSRLFWVARRLTSRHEDAEDIVQEALLKAFRALPRFRGDARMDTWLHTIVRNAAIEYLRKRKGQTEISLDQHQAGTEDVLGHEFPDPGESPEESYGRRELVNALRSGMNEVSAMYKLAVEMCVLDELPYREVARDLKVSAAALKSRVFHGKRMLRNAVHRRMNWRESPSITAVPSAGLEGAEHGASGSISNALGAFDEEILETGIQ